MSKKNMRATTQSSSNLIWLVAVAMIALAALGFVLLQAPSGAKGLPSEITTAEALAKRNAGAFILDVREPSEWNEFHVPNSTLIPLGSLASRVNQVPRDKEIVVVCRSGNRSTTGRDILLQAGFTNVTSLAGGLNGWKAAGYPTVTGP